MFSQTSLTLAHNVITLANQHNIKIITAESCTSGLVAATLTAIPGASTCVEGGVITYSNQLKQDYLGVLENSIIQYGAVSEQVAQEMALGALANKTSKYLSISVTGIAGPGGGTKNKPVGTVCFAIGHQNNIIISKRQCFNTVFQKDGREGVRSESVKYCLQEIISYLKSLSL